MPVVIMLVVLKAMAVPVMMSVRLQGACPVL